MRRKVVNIVVRNPSDIIDHLQKYETLKFSPLVDSQIHFEDLVGKDITDVSKTEIYINGVRYPLDSYEIVDGNILKWYGHNLKLDDVIVFVWR